MFIMNPLRECRMGVTRCINHPSVMYIPYSPLQLSTIFATDTLVQSSTQKNRVGLHSVGRVPQHSATVGGERIGHVKNIDLCQHFLSTGRHLLRVSFTTRLIYSSNYTERATQWRNWLRHFPMVSLEFFH